MTATDHQAIANVIEVIESTGPLTRKQVLLLTMENAVLMDMHGKEISKVYVYNVACERLGLKF